MSDIAKDLAPGVYDDALKPAVKATGGLLELLPRAVRAALAPIEKWILHRE